MPVYTEEEKKYSSIEIEDMRWLRKYMSDNIGNNVTKNISLPAEGPKGSKITWTSSHEGYISNMGIEDSSKYVGVKNLDGLSEGIYVS